MDLLLSEIERLFKTWMKEVLDEGKPKVVISDVAAKSFGSDPIMNLALGLTPRPPKKKRASCKGYKHTTKDEANSMKMLHDRGLNHSEIGRILNKTSTTVSRVLNGGNKRDLT